MNPTKAQRREMATMAHKATTEERRLAYELLRDAGWGFDRDGFIAPDGQSFLIIGDALRHARRAA